MLPRVASRRLLVFARATAGLVLAATLAGCELWPFGDPGQPPQRTAPAQPSPPRLPSPTILIPPPI